MKSMRSTFQQIGIVACGLSLSLFGCPQTGNEVDGGADTGLQAAGDPAGGGGGNTGAGGDTGGGSGGDAGGGGGGDAGGGSDPLDRSALVRPGSPTLFVADVDKGVKSFANAHVLNGNVAPTTFIDAFERFRVTDELFPMSADAVCVDRVGTLVVHTTTPALRFYNNAATVTGIPAPNREIGDLGASQADDGGIAYDRENDRLFVVIDDRVLIFEGAALAQTGNVAPTRSFSHPDIPGASIALGPNGDLYVTGGFQTVLVFSNAGLRSGPITPDRTIFLSFFSRETVFVDSFDRLYVTDFNEIAVLENASTLDGTVEDFPVITLLLLSGAQVLGAPAAVQSNISGLVVDSRGIGYVAVGEEGVIHVIDNIGTRSGGVRADRAILYSSAIESGDADAIFLWE